MTWHTPPQARAILASIESTDLSVMWEASLRGPDRFILVGPPREALQAIIQAHAADQFGCTFREAEQQGRVHEYMDAFKALPTVEQVLNEWFGDPNRLGFEMPLPCTSRSRPEWTVAWRGQFPRKQEAA